MYILSKSRIGRIIIHISTCKEGKFSHFVPFHKRFSHLPMMQVQAFGLALPSKMRNIFDTCFRNKYGETTSREFYKINYQETAE